MGERGNGMPAGRTRCVLVTGACGGLGAAVTARLSALGDLVFAVDANLQGLASLSEHPGVVTIQADVTASADLARARVVVERRTDGLDGLVLAAGVFTGGPLVEVSEEAMQRALDVNLMGAFRVVRELFPLLARRRGTVVAVSSESARCAMPFNGPYTVSKCALEAYCDVLRRELMFAGVAVSILQPGAMRTALLEDAEHALGDRAAQSSFASYLGRALQVLMRDRRTSMDPGRVAEVVVRLLRARKPRLRYRIGNRPLRALLGKIPARWADGLIRRFC